MIEHIFSLNNLNDTQKFASNIAKLAKIGDTITLSGDLGVGKTSFSQFFINSFGGEQIEVTSPTFNLLNIYNLTEFDIWHFDLYRLKNQKEIYELGFEDALDKGITLIEWPEIIASLLPKDRLEIKFSFPKNSNLEENTARIVTISAFGKWEKQL